MLADEQRKADQAEADLATKTHFQNVREQVSDLKDRLLSIWSQVSDETVGVVNVGDLYIRATITSTDLMAGSYGCSEAGIWRCGSY
jgi:hypothetical protein